MAGAGAILLSCRGAKGGASTASSRQSRCSRKAAIRNTAPQKNDTIPTRISRTYSRACPHSAPVKSGSCCRIVCRLPENSSPDCPPWPYCGGQHGVAARLRTCSAGATSEPESCRPVSVRPTHIDRRGRPWLTVRRRRYVWAASDSSLRLALCVGSRMDVPEVGVGVVPVHASRLDQAHLRRRALTSTQAAGERTSYCAHAVMCMTARHGSLQAASGHGDEPKLNGHDPHAYLTDVLQRLPIHPNNRIDELLPHRWLPAA